MTTPTIISAARRIAAQLDARGNRDLTGLPETLCRALKVQEEAGEMAQAVIGVLGQNPRKGVTHSWDDVVAEAIDTALSALVLAETVQPGMLGVTLAGQLERLQQRAEASGAPDSTPARPEAELGGDGLTQRRAATLQWLLSASWEHALPLPASIDAREGGTIHLTLDDDDQDGVRRWAALLGATVGEPRHVTHGTNQWTSLRAETPYGTDPGWLGWEHIQISTMCDYRPVTEPAPLAVVA